MPFRLREGRVVIPVALLLGAVIVLALIVPHPGLIATKILVGLIVVGLVWLIVWHARRTNIAIARFLNALSHSDLSAGFSGEGEANGFGALGAAMDRLLRRLQRERTAAMSANQFAAALVDEVPTALLVIEPENVVLLVNKASRRLFPGGHGRAVGEFSRYGGEFELALGAASPGTRGTCRLLVDGLLQRTVITCAAVEREGRVSRAVSVQVIQNELDAVELATQVDLVRILTHEIMNSMTPVTSLAASAARLIAEVQLGDSEALTDARVAIDTLARRTEGINHFVECYRAFSDSPSVTKKRFEVLPWLEELVRSFCAGEYGRGTHVEWSLAPMTLYIDGDANLLGQVLLNLLKNGAEAAKGHCASPRVAITIALHGSSRVRIVVSDNGPGVLAAIRSDIFLPFFTTKASGMGVGLSFARQIVLLHGGVIGIIETSSGASFEIVF